MNGKAFFDTNILVYTIGQHDTRTAIAESLLGAGGIVSVQVLNELAAVMQRKLRMPWEEIAEALVAVRVLCPSPTSLTSETHDAALDLARRHGWHIYDALIVAAALQAGCSTLFTEDLQHGRVIDGRLTIVNPFRPDSSTR
jgi:predicted nucleic acid-binding protein